MDAERRACETYVQGEACVLNAFVVWETPRRQTNRGKGKMTSNASFKSDGLLKEWKHLVAYLAFAGQ